MSTVKECCPAMLTTPSHAHRPGAPPSIGLEAMWLDSRVAHQPRNPSEHHALWINPLLAPPSKTERRARSPRTSCLVYKSPVEAMDGLGRPRRRCGRCGSSIRTAAVLRRLARPSTGQPWRPCGQALQTCSLARCAPPYLGRGATHESAVGLSTGPAML